MTDDVRLVLYLVLGWLANNLFHEIRDRRHDEREHRAWVGRMDGRLAKFKADMERRDAQLATLEVEYLRREEADR